MKTLQINYTGRKAHIGRTCFDEQGKMCVFVGYCGCKGKVLMSVEEARRFSRLFQAEQGTLWNRLMFFLVERRKAVVAPPGTSEAQMKEDILSDLLERLKA